MPSAKLEKHPSSESLDPFKQCVNLFEKKVRNLEKRKGKLDAYKETSKQGKELNEDQKLAVSKYGEVEAGLEMMKESLKQVTTIHADYVKLQKKQTRREQLERHQAEINRMKTVLIFQDILNRLGDPRLRKDLIAGENRAVKLTEAQLNSIDQLYGLLNPIREVGGEKKFDAVAGTSAEIWNDLLDGRSKEVVGSTFAELKEVLTAIHESGHIDNPPKENEPADTNGDAHDGGGDNEVNGDDFTEEQQNGGSLTQTGSDVQGIGKQETESKSRHQVHRDSTEGTSPEPIPTPPSPQPHLHHHPHPHPHHQLPQMPPQPHQVQAPSHQLPPHQHQLHQHQLQHHHHQQQQHAMGPDMSMDHSRRMDEPLPQRQRAPVARQQAQPEPVDDSLFSSAAPYNQKLIDGIAGNITFIHDSELGVGSDGKMTPSFQAPVMQQPKPQQPPHPGLDVGMGVGVVSVPAAMHAQQLAAAGQLQHPSPVPTPPTIPTQTFTNQNYAAAFESSSLFSSSAAAAVAAAAAAAVTAPSVVSRTGPTPPPGIDTAPNPPPPIPMPPSAVLVPTTGVVASRPQQQQIPLGSHHPPGFAQAPAVPQGVGDSGWVTNPSPTPQQPAAAPTPPARPPQQTHHHLPPQQQPMTALPPQDKQPQIDQWQAPQAMAAEQQQQQPQQQRGEGWAVDSGNKWAAPQQVQQQQPLQQPQQQVKPEPKPAPAPPVNAWATKPQAWGMAPQRQPVQNSQPPAPPAQQQQPQTKSQPRKEGDDDWGKWEDPNAPPGKSSNWADEAENNAMDTGPIGTFGQDAKEKESLANQARQNRGGYGRYGGSRGRGTGRRGSPNRYGGTGSGPREGSGGGGGGRGGGGGYRGDRPDRGDRMDRGDRGDRMDRGDRAPYRNEKGPGGDGYGGGGGGGGGNYNGYRGGGRGAPARGGGSGGGGPTRGGMAPRPGGGAGGGAGPNNQSRPVGMQRQGN